MFANSSSQQHEMQYVGIEQKGKWDLEFEFICPDCGYRVAVPLFEVLANGEFTVSHAENIDGPQTLLITLQEKNIELPDVFKGFFDTYEDDA
jgi:hypothetical protein